jgi:hypothetical protein
LRFRLESGTSGAKARIISDPLIAALKALLHPYLAKKLLHPYLAKK